MTFAIRGWGVAVPQGHISQTDALQHAVEMLGQVTQRHEALATLYRRTSVLKRHSVLLESSTNGRPARQSFYAPAADPTDGGPSTQQRMQRYETDAAGLAETAARQALAAAGWSPADVTHLITASCSGFSAPGVDLQLMQRLALPPEVSRTHVGFMGCHGAFNALRVAQAYASDPQARVLVCCVELCSLHQQYSPQADSIVANALFADGAAAVAGQASGNKTSHEPANWQLVAQHSHVLPETADLMTWRIGNHGFQMTLSSEVPTVIEHALANWLDQWLTRFDLRREDIRSWAVHPGGPRILQACERALHLDPAALQTSRQVLESFGNMSSPTILFILNELRTAGRPTPCVALAFGPGLTIEAALWKSTD